MENFVHGKKIIEFWKFTGEVLDSHKSSETHVFSRGGGPSPGGGSIAPTVESRVIKNHELWIRTDDGTEKSLEFSDVDIPPMRVGHKISVICAGVVPATSGVYAAIVNHSTSTHRLIRDGAFFQNKFSFERVTGVSVIFSLLVWALFSLIFSIFADSGDAMGVAWVPAGIYFSWRVIRKTQIITASSARFLSHLEKVIQTVH